MPFNFVQLIAILVGLVVAITIHEFSHALVARQLGDPTAERMGRLSLNPLVHLDPLGSIMMLITAITGFGIGWGKPTPVNPWNLRPGRRLGMAIVALGGPISNLLLALVFSVVLHLAPTMPLAVMSILVQMAALNLGLAAFNILPLPMLDGFHVLMGIVSSIRTRGASTLVGQLERIEAQGSMILLILIMAGYVFRFPILTILIQPIFGLLAKLVGLG